MKKKKKNLKDEKQENHETQEKQEMEMPKIEVKICLEGDGEGSGDDWEGGDYVNDEFPGWNGKEMEM